MQHGYQQKNGMCHVTWKTVTVQQSLAALEDEHTRRECQQAYNLLMNTPTSLYKAFINKHNEALETNEKINLYDYSAIEGIECCLWPHLYPYTDLCETTLKGNESRLSGKIAFLNKVFSNILDYGLTYDAMFSSESSKCKNIFRRLLENPASTFSRCGQTVWVS